MADNVTTQSGTLATVPASTKIATDEDATNGHVQIVKLAVSTNGSATPLTADNTDGLLVNLGTNNDVTLATLPDTAAGDLAAINSAISGTLTVGSHAVTNAGTFAVQEDGAALTALQLIDDAVYTDDTSTHATGTSKGYGVMAVATPTDGSVDANDFGHLAMSTDRRLLVDAQIVGTDAALDVSAATVTVSGTVTSNLSATDNAVLDQIQTNTANLTNALVQDDAPFTPATGYLMMIGGEYDDAGTDSVDEGDAGNVRISANRSMYVQLRDAAGNERGVNINASNELTVIESNSAAILADTANMDTNLATLAGAVSGNEMQADVLTMPGTAAEGAALPAAFVVVAGDDGTDTHPLQLDASGHLQVDIAADSVGIGGGTQYTEDDAAAANPVGTVPILVRADTPATLTSLDGDNVAQRATNYGAAYVQVVDSSGNFVDSFSGSGGTSATDDAAFTAGSGSGTPAMGFFSTDTVNSGDVGVLAMDASRRLLVSIEADNAGIGGGTQYAVDAALGATPTGTLAVAIRDDALSALTPVEGDAIGLRVDANGALWVIPSGTTTVDNGGTFAVQVDAALPAGDNNIGNVDIASSVALDVSAATVTVDSELPAAAALADNAANPTAPAVGAFGMVWDGATWDRLPGTSADGVTVNLGSNNDITVSGTVTVDNAGTFAVQVDGDALTALQKIDDPVLVDDAAFTPATSSVMMAGFEYDDITPDSVDEGDAGAARMSANRNIYTQIRDAAGNERGVNVNASNELTVIESNSAAILADTANMDTNLGTIAGAVSGGQVQVDIVADGAGLLTTAAHDAAFGTAGTADTQVRTVQGIASMTPLLVDATGQGDVPITLDGEAVAISGTVTVDLGANNDVIAAGDVASDSADSGNPVKVGGKAYNFDGTAPGTAVAENDRTNFITDVYGRQYVETAHPNNWTVSADYASAQTNASIKAAPGAGLKLYITDVVISNGATAGNITLLDGSGGTVLVEIYPAANGGMAMPFRTPIALTANTALVITSTTVTTHSVTINGYIAP